MQRGTRKAVERRYVVGMSLCRLYLPLCEYSRAVPTEGHALTLAPARRLSALPGELRRARSVTNDRIAGCALGWRTSDSADRAVVLRLALLRPAALPPGEPELGMAPAFAHAAAASGPRHGRGGAGRLFSLPERDRGGSQRGGRGRTGAPARRRGRTGVHTIRACSAAESWLRAATRRSGPPAPPEQHQAFCATRRHGHALSTHLPHGLSRAVVAGQDGVPTVSHAAPSSLRLDDIFIAMRKEEH